MGLPQYTISIGYIFFASLFFLLLLLLLLLLFLLFPLVRGGRALFRKEHFVISQITIPRISNLHILAAMNFLKAYPALRDVLENHIFQKLFAFPSGSSTLTLKELIILIYKKLSLSGARYPASELSRALNKYIHTLKNIPHFKG